MLTKTNPEADLGNATAGLTKFPKLLADSNIKSLSRPIAPSTGQITSPVNRHGFRYKWIQMMTLRLLVFIRN